MVTTANTSVRCGLQQKKKKKKKKKKKAGQIEARNDVGVERALPLP